MTRHFVYTLFLHHEQFMLKKFISELPEVLSHVIKILNIIRPKSLIKALFEKIGSQYTHIILHAKVGRILIEKKINLAQRS